MDNEYWSGRPRHKSGAPNYTVLVPIAFGYKRPRCEGNSSDLVNFKNEVFTMTKTNIAENLLLEDLNLFETIKDDVGSKVVGGALPCNEASRQRVLAGLQASGLINAQQVATLSQIPLADFCTDFGEYLEVQLGVKVFNEIEPVV